MVAWRGTTLDLVTGESTRPPWRSADQVGFEPDGTPVFVAADIDGSAIRFEWNGDERVARAPVVDVDVSSSRHVGVSSNAAGGGSADGGATVVDARTGATVGELRHGRGVLAYTDQWIDDETLFVAAAPYFLAWRPVSGALLRVADARTPGGYWDVDLVPPRRRVASAGP